MFFLLLLVLPSLFSISTPSSSIYTLSLTSSSNQFYLGFSYKMNFSDDFHPFPLFIDLYSSTSYLIENNQTESTSLFQSEQKRERIHQDENEKKEKENLNEKTEQSNNSGVKQNERILNEKRKGHLDIQKSFVNFAEIAFDEELKFQSASFLIQNTASSFPPISTSSPSSSSFSSSPSFSSPSAFSSSKSHAHTSSPDASSLFLPSFSSGYFGLNLFSPDSKTFTISTMIHEMQRNKLIKNRSFSLDIRPNHEKSHLVLGGFNESLLGSKKSEVKVREEGGKWLEFGLAKTSIYFSHNEIFRSVINLDIKMRLSVKEERILLPNFHLQMLTSILQRIYKSCSLVKVKEGANGKVEKVGEEKAPKVGGGATEGVKVGMEGDPEIEKESEEVDEDEGEEGELYCVDNFGFISTKYPLLFFEKNGVTLKIHSDDYLEKCNRVGNGLTGCWLKIGVSKQNNTVVLGRAFLQANSLLVDENGGIAFRFKDFDIDDYFIDHDWYYTFYALLIVWGISMLACGLYFRGYMERLNRLTHKITLIFYHKCRDRINGRNNNNDDMDDSDEEEEEEERAGQHNNNVNNNNNNNHHQNNINNLNNGQNNIDNNLNGMNSNINGQNNQNLDHAENFRNRD